MAQVIYQPTALVGTTKKGKLKCDPDGYYDVCVGGFDTYNSAGAYYTMNSAQSHFDASHDFQRRIRNGALYGENGHPKFNPAMSKRDWLIRIMTLDENNKSHHIRELSLDDSVFKNKDGRPMVAVFARIKPAGPHAQALGDSLDNEYENTAFSIRSLTNDHVDHRGVTIKNMQAISTYDWVPEPGIDKATKYMHPGLESYNMTAFTDRNIKDAIAHVRDMFDGTGLEDHDYLVPSLESLLLGDTAKPKREIELALPTWKKWF